MMMKFHIMLILILILVSGCTQPSNRQKTTTTITQPTTSTLLEQKYSVHIFTLILSGKTVEDTVAISSFNRTNENPAGTPNTAFRQYFSEDINKLAGQEGGISEINVRNWFGTFDAVVIEANYSKNSLSPTDLTSKFSNLWYVKNIQEENLGERY